MSSIEDVGSGSIPSAGPMTMEMRRWLQFEKFLVIQTVEHTQRAKSAETKRLLECKLRITVSLCENNDFLLFLIFVFR